MNQLLNSEALYFNGKERERYMMFVLLSELEIFVKFSHRSKGQVSFLQGLPPVADGEAYIFSYEEIFAVAYNNMKLLKEAVLLAEDEVLTNDILLLEDLLDVFLAEGNVETDSTEKEAVVLVEDEADEKEYFLRLKALLLKFGSSPAPTGYKFTGVFNEDEMESGEMCGIRFANWHRADTLLEAFSVLLVFLRFCGVSLLMASDVN